MSSAVTLSFDWGLALPVGLSLSEDSLLPDDLPGGLVDGWEEDWLLLDDWVDDIPFPDDWAGGFLVADDWIGAFSVSDVLASGSWPPIAVELVDLISVSRSEISHDHGLGWCGALAGAVSTGVLLALWVFACANGVWPDGRFTAQFAKRRSGALSLCAATGANRFAGVWLLPATLGEDTGAPKKAWRVSLSERQCWESTSAYRRELWKFGLLASRRLRYSSQLMRKKADGI